MDKMESGRMAIVSAPKVSVVICTYNRPLMLEVAIKSCLANATRKSLDYEIVIADNSTDAHALPVIERLKGAAIPIRHTSASPPNIAIARNAGVRASQAPFIAFLDDDSEVEPGWLDALYETIVASGADTVSGPVRAKFEGAPPEWDKTGELFSRLVPYPTGTPIPILGPDRDSSVAIGTSNSIFRVETSFTDKEPFDPVFGAAGGEDTDFLMRAARRGKRVVWCAEAIATEIIPAARTEFSNQMMRVFSSTQGYAAARIKNSESPVVTAASVMFRGSLQGLIYGLATLPLALLSLVAPRAGDPFRKTALKMSAGLGKAFWWRRLRYYHMEKPRQARLAS